MALERTPKRVSLVRCPVPGCDADLRGYTKTSHHFYVEHTPEDFGLTPLCEAVEGGESA